MQSLREIESSLAKLEDFCQNNPQLGRKTCMDHYTDLHES